ncbi:MAG: hypothetical protein AB7D05_04175 [Mangrovibacterium sp.]
MIKTGILTDHQPDDKQLRQLRQIERLEISAVQTILPARSDEQTERITQVIRSSDLIYTDMKQPPAKLIRLILRNSRHLFFREIPRLSMQEISGLIRLEEEAGSISQIFLPLLYLPENLKQLRELHPPLLADFRLQAIPQVSLTRLLLDKLLLLAVLKPGPVKKTEVNSLEQGTENHVTDIRISFSSGTTVRFLLATCFPCKEPVAEFFRAGRAPLVLPAGKMHAAKRQRAVHQALKELLLALDHRPSVLISFDELYQAQQMIRQIREKLELRGSRLL